MTNVADEPKTHVVPDVIRIDQEQVRSHVDEVVRSTVEETLNGLLEQMVVQSQRCDEARARVK